MSHVSLAEWTLDMVMSIGCSASLFLKQLECMKEDSGQLLVRVEVVVALGRNGLGMTSLMSGRSRLSQQPPLPRRPRAMKEQWLGSVVIVIWLAATLQRVLVGLNDHQLLMRLLLVVEGRLLAESAEIGVAAGPESARSQGCSDRWKWRDRPDGGGKGRRRVRLEEISMWWLVCARLWFLVLRQRRSCCMFAARAAKYVSTQNYCSTILG